MKKYLNYIKNKYSDFRYFSDKNILDNLEDFKNINYRILSNNIWFCIIYTDLRISKNTCFFWFLEIYEKNSFKIFFEEIQREAKNILSIEGFSPLDKISENTLVWPINLSIWNTYRFWNFENDSKVILWEYETNKNLNKIFLENNFRIYEKYITAKRFWENPYPLNISTEGFKSLNDFEIRKIKRNKETLKLIFDLSSQIFTNAPKINYEEFEKFMQVYLELYKENLSEFILTYKWKEIWFLSSFYNKKYFVIKTVWILKEFRWKWFWNYILSYVYDYYLNLGFNESYYLYMREKWDALNMTDENAEDYREYFTYYIEL